MPAKLPTVRTIKALRAKVGTWRGSGDTIGLVPTMGALHEGHLSLVREMRRRADRTIVSIFVNPAQFGPSEDLERYPRDEAGDKAKLAELGVDLVFAPPAREVYPPEFATSVNVAGPALTELEDRFRPHFFGGVATVVCKLLTQCGPDLAIFGDKDYQQLMVIRRMARDLDLPVKIFAGKTVREDDGLALSSRNAYLDAAQRRAAPLLHQVLRDIAEKMSNGENAAKALRAGKAKLTRAGFRVDYLEARNADTLEPLAGPEPGPARLLVAAWLGTTRLIDNLPVGKPRA